MAFDDMAWAWSQRIAPMQKLVLMALADRRNKDTGQCNPSVARIAGDAAVSVRTARQCLRELEAMGLVTAEVREHETSSYTLHRGRHVEPPPPADRAASPGTKCRPPRQDVPTPPAPPAAKPVTKPVREPKDPPTPRKRGDGVAEAFAEFWALYPRKTAKLAAEKAFAKAAEDADRVIGMAGHAHMVTEGLRLQMAKFDLREDMRFVKHPATWLNAGCWLDAFPGLGDPDPDPAPPGPNGKHPPAQPDLI